MLGTAGRHTRMIDGKIEVEAAIPGPPADPGSLARALQQMRLAFVVRQAALQIAVHDGERRARGFKPGQRAVGR